MRFNIEIWTENAAFDPDPGVELARILDDIKTQVEPKGHPKGGERHSGSIRDFNGNKVGAWEWE